jgi:hypothetical protein
MKKFLGAAAGTLLLAASAPALAWTGSVHWVTIIGIIDAGNVVDGITGGGAPWSTLGGEASVDLATGTVAFDVRGLVLAGGNTIGTTGGVTTIEGTLVCGLTGTPTAVVSTPPVMLSAEGNAEFSGPFTGSTAPCTAPNVAFLVTIPSNGHWIANGSVLVAP